MKKKKEEGNGLLNLTSIVIGAFLLVVGIAVGLILNSSSSFALDTSDLKYGDLNCDGEVTSTDMVTLARAVRGMITLTEEQKIVADVNTDGNVDKYDEYILVLFITNYDNTKLPYTGPVPAVNYGDADLDGYVTSDDRVVLANYITGKAEFNLHQKMNSDLNFDGNIDNCDAELLSQYLTDKTPLPYIVMATPSNATASNATSPNATSTNATASNAAVNDNVLYMNKVGLKSSETTPGSKVSLTFDVTGTCNYSARIYFGDSSTEYSFGVDVKDLNTDNPYIVIPTNIPGGQYTIQEVILYGLNSDNTTFTRQYSSINSNADVFADFIGEDKTIKVVRNTSAETDIKLGNVSLSKSSVKVGEQVNVNIEHKENMFNMMLVFKSDNSGHSFKVYLDRFNIKYEGCYFIVPTNIYIDSYHLFQIIVSDGGTTNIYTRGDNLEDIALEITANEKNTYIYSNINFEEKQIQEIYNAPDDTKIVIDANINPIVNEEVFKAIKGTNKQLVINYQGNEIVFKGNDISNPKTIDVNISISESITVEDNQELSTMVKDGVVINLSSNGTLPGKAVYRIYATDEMKKLLGNKNIYLYYYDETNNNFNLVQTNVKLNGNYYELSINHNSKYVLTKNKIDSQYVVKESNNIVGFQNSDTVNMLLIVCGIALILVVVIVILILKKKRKQRNRK